MRTLRVWLEVHTASKSHRTRKDFKERAITFLCLVLKIKGRNLSKKDKRKETRNNFRSQGIKKKRKENNFPSFPFFFPSFQTKNQAGKEGNS